MSAENPFDHEEHVVLSRPTSVTVGADGKARVEISALPCPELTEEQVIGIVATRYGLDPDTTRMVKTSSLGGSQGKRSWGINDWSGCSWEPTGPKADPGLN